MNLTHAQLGQEYTITGIDTDDEELDSFLFTLGCYTGEPSPWCPNSMTATWCQ